MFYKDTLPVITEDELTLILAKIKASIKTHLVDYVDEKFKIEDFIDDIESVVEDRFLEHFLIIDKE